MQWQRVLHQKQSFPSNYMENVKKKKINLNRLDCTNIATMSIMISLAFIFFNMFLSLRSDKVNFIEDISFLSSMFVGGKILKELAVYISKNFYFHEKDSYLNVRQPWETRAMVSDILNNMLSKTRVLAAIIIAMVVCILRPLVLKGGEDSLLAVYLILHIINSFDKIRCVILNTHLQIQLEEPVPLEISILLPSNCVYIPFIGHLSHLIATWLLISHIDMFCGACLLGICDLLFFVILPHYIIPCSFKKYAFAQTLATILLKNNQWIFYSFLMVQGCWLFVSLFVYYMLKFLKRK